MPFSLDPVYGRVVPLHARFPSDPGAVRQFRHHDEGERRKSVMLAIYDLIALCLFPRRDGVSPPSLSRELLWLYRRIPTRPTMQCIQFVLLGLFVVTLTIGTLAAIIRVLVGCASIDHTPSSTLSSACVFIVHLVFDLTLGRPYCAKNIGFSLFGCVRPQLVPSLP
ncbi:hypothetical protein CPB86DRAFT_316414 [Serendipita vermifera]|nr:hypothetical protein CPB86DRAFT_316414 [Serendipita vermifera]